jgi:hypothetical protein
MVLRHEVNREHMTACYFWVREIFSTLQTQINCSSVTQKRELGESVGGQGE